MAKFINPFTDVGFKIIFGQEMTKGLLIDFLNDLDDRCWQVDGIFRIGVFFMNFRLDDSPGKLHTDIVLSDRDTHEVFSDKLRFIFIELPAFTKEEEECITDFERWIYVLKNMETLNRLPFKARKAVFEKLEKIIDSHH